MASLWSKLKGQAATEGVGYETGAGGTVTQITSKATGVTLNKVCGTITTHNANLVAGTSVSFVVTNSTVAATDVPLVVMKSGGTVGSYDISVDAVGSGSFTVNVKNKSGGDLAEALVLSFALVKAVAS